MFIHSGGGTTRGHEPSLVRAASLREAVKKQDSAAAAAAAASAATAAATVGIPVTVWDTRETEMAGKKTREVKIATNPVRSNSARDEGVRKGLSQYWHDLECGRWNKGRWQGPHGWPHRDHLQPPLPRRSGPTRPLYHHEV